MKRFKNLVLGFVAMSCVVLLTSQAGAQSEEHSTPLQLKYLGAAGWEISDGNVVVLIDPYISRLKYGGVGHPDDDRPNFARDDVARSDTDLIDSIISRADFILVHHGHFDHLGDVPYIAEKTGAKVIGTETTITILRAYGIPEDQLYAVGGGEDYQFENFSVRVVPSIHSALGEKHYFDTRRLDRDSDIEAPLRINQFIEGGSLMFLARFDHHDVLTMGSMNFIEREVEGLNPVGYRHVGEKIVTAGSPKGECCERSGGDTQDHQGPEAPEVSRASHAPSRLPLIHGAQRAN